MGGWGTNKPPSLKAALLFKPVQAQSFLALLWAFLIQQLESRVAPGHATPHNTAILRGSPSYCHFIHV